ncbi:alpha/beta hydrolase [Streptomyces sp. NPDC096323]|uniref:alpha/beta fold hydrolase n=1 Tax=Streptomyces sp. NPDC096323 TaxID=3155822 RepID=UPI00332D7DDA
MAPIAALAGIALNLTSRVSNRLAGHGAYRLFHMPLARSGIRPAEQELFATAEVQRMEAGGRSTVVYRWGNGERPVILVHGWQSRGSRLADFIPGLLASGHSVITFDAPAHGDSAGRSTTIQDYRHILTGLQERYGEFDAVVAHSLGALGSFFALRHGVRTKRIATISGVCDYEYLIDEFCSTVPLRPRLKARLRALVVKNLFSDLPADQRPFSAANGTAASLGIPLLVVHDADDLRIRVEQGHRLADAFGDRARLVVTSGLGHRRILGDPEVVAAVLDFVGHGRIAEAGTEAVTAR